MVGHYTAQPLKILVLIFDGCFQPVLTVQIKGHAALVKPMLTVKSGMHRERKVLLSCADLKHRRIVVLKPIVGSLPQIVWGSVTISMVSRVTVTCFGFLVQISSLDKKFSTSNAPSHLSFVVLNRQTSLFPHISSFRHTSFPLFLLAVFVNGLAARIIFRPAAAGRDHVFEPAAPRPVLREHPQHVDVKSCRMVHLFPVAQLMDHHAVDDLRRRQHQETIEAEVPFAGTSAPPGFLTADVIEP